VEVARFAPDVTVGRIVPDLAVSDALPENAKLLQPFFRRVAGDDGRVDAADRDTADPVGFKASFMQGLIDADLEAPSAPPPCSTSATRSHRSGRHVFAMATSASGDRASMTKTPVFSVATELRMAMTSI
jgi:hypothetical protein